MFLKVVEKIQNQSRRFRIQVLWLSVFVCMFLIISLWIASFKKSSNFSQSKEESDQASQILDQVKKGVPSLKETFKASIGAFFEEDLEQIEQELENIENIDQIDLKEEINQPAKLPLK